VKTWSFQRKAFASALLLMILSVSTVGTVTFAQEGTTVPPDATTTQPVQNNDDGFPWGLLGLLGLGGLAGLRRQPETRTVETIDASRHR
jgi:MYXO-CTERM domain-containing protein